MAEMTVVEATAAGGPEVLRPARRERPEPAATEVLVRVHAAGVNPVDWKTRAGAGVAGLLGTPPWVLGWDVSGVVEQLGAGVTRFSVGDAVYGMPRFPHQAGGYAEYVTGPSRHFACKPGALDHVHAAGLPLAGLTAWQALIDTADLQAGQRVLIHAAGGGVGHLAVQLARWRGAHVTGTASAIKHDRLRALGADELIDHTTTRFEDVIGDIDVAIDLGGSYGSRSLHVLRPGGLLIVDPSASHVVDQSAQDPRGVRAQTLLVEPDGHALEQLARLAGNGLLTVDVAAVFDLTDIAEAHCVGESSRTFGKLIAQCVSSTAVHDPKVPAPEHDRHPGLTPPCHVPGTP